MSLATNVTNLAIRVASEAKALRTLVNGNAADLTGLTTTAKTNLVAAINEIAAAVGSAGASIDDASVSTLSVWSSSKTNTSITSAVSALVAASPTTLDTLNELAAALGDDPNFATTITAALGGKEPLITGGTTAQYRRGDKSWQTLDKSAVGLSAVDNTSDANKPISTATATALAGKQPTGSYATQTDLTNGLAPKAPLASPTFTGTVGGITKSMVGLGSVDNTADSAKPVSGPQATALALKAPLASPTFTGTVSGVTKSMVGLASVDNTADSAKPVSTAQQTALNAKANTTDVGDTTTDYVATFEAGLV